MHKNHCKPITAKNCGSYISFDECDSCISKAYYKN